MELIPIECGNCKAKLKIKAMPARMPTEVKCPKCGKSIPVGKGAPSAPAADPSPAPVQPPAILVAPAPVTPAPIVAQPVTPPPPPPRPAPPPPPAPAPAPASSTAQLTPPPKPIQPMASAQQSATPKKAAAPIVIGQVAEPANTATITVTCPTCQLQTKVTQTLIGKKIRCKQCSGIVPVSGPDPVTPVAPSIDIIPAVPPVQPAKPEGVATPPPAPVIPAATAAPTPIAAPPPQAPIQPIAQSTPPPLSLADTLNATRTSPGTTLLVGEIATLKSKLEAASKESILSLKRLEEAEIKVQQAEARAKDAENALHEQAGKAAIGAATAQHTIEELTDKVAALTQTIARNRAAMANAQAALAAELQAAQRPG